jgi:hypothetical protein
VGDRAVVLMEVRVHRERFNVHALANRPFVRLEAVNQFDGPETLYVGKKQMRTLIDRFLDGKCGEIETDTTWPPVGMVETGDANAPESRTPCACGCGESLPTTEPHRPNRRFIRGHNPKGKNRVKD